MALTLDALLGSPDHYLHSFDAGEAVFVPMDRAAYRRSIFLDRRISPARTGAVRLPHVVLAGVPTGQPCDWIFHIAHCGSTLLARALDELGAETDGRLVLREPLTLRQLALEHDPGALLSPTLALLARRYPGAGPTLIKANVPVNFLLPQIAAAQPAARALFLYSDLADYLLAILRSDQHRTWLRTVTDQLAEKIAEPLPESDPERAALLWIAQLRRFAAALVAWPDACSLEAETFFAQPEETLHAAAALFEQSGSEVESLVAGPLFNSYSKNPAQAFDNAARLERQTMVKAEIAGEIEQAAGWIAHHAPDAPAVLAAIRGRSL